MDRIASMGVFVKTVDLGSLTAAAAALGMSPQMVGNTSASWRRGSALPFCAAPRDGRA